MQCIGHYMSHVTRHTSHVKQKKRYRKPVHIWLVEVVHVLEVAGALACDGDGRAGACNKVRWSGRTT